MTENNDELRKVWNLIHKYQTEGLSRDQIKSKLKKKKLRNLVEDLT